MSKVDLERNNGKDCHYMKEEFFQEISNKLRILDVNGDKKRDKNVFKRETSHPIKQCITRGQLGVDYIESWFQSIVIQAMQSNFGHYWLSLTLMNIGNVLNSLMESSILFSSLNFITNISWILEWFIGNILTLEKCPFPLSRLGQLDFVYK